MIMKPAMRRAAMTAQRGLTANAPVALDMARKARRKPASHFAP